MTPPPQTLRLFLTSLAISLAWYAYHSKNFVLLLDRLLLGSAVVYLALAAQRWYQRRWGAPSDASRPPDVAHRRSALRSGAWWNTLAFFSLVFAASSIATVRYQFSRAEFIGQIGLQALALIAIALAAAILTRPRPVLVFHLPLALGSLLLGQELYRTRLHPPLNQSVELAPVFQVPFICYNGGESRLTNDHFGIPQRRYLSGFVPGDTTFRAPGESALAQRDRAAFGTPVFAPVNGTVISVVSHLPDLPSGQADPSHPAGNHLCLQLGPDRFLYLANLQQHSVLPQVGETVTVGAPLARLGKNGSFTESALVVLVVDNPNVILPETRSLPFYFSGLQPSDGAPSSLRFPRRNQILRPQKLPLASFWPPPTEP